MTSTAPTSTEAPVDRERVELLETLARHRYFLRHTVQGITDEQARQRLTASELTLGGLIKHVTAAEHQWMRFVQVGAEAMKQDEESYVAWAAAFRMEEHETLDELLAAYDQVIVRTEEIVGRLPHLDVAHPLPEAPWFEPGATWSARRVLLHLIAETSQHAGHADILRETLDGQKTMG